jgi:hypothetical protein
LSTDISNANLLPEKSMDDFQSYVIKNQDATFGACNPEVSPSMDTFQSFVRPIQHTKSIKDTVFLKVTLLW